MFPVPLMLGSVWSRSKRESLNETLETVLKPNRDPDQPAHQHRLIRY